MVLEAMSCVQKQNTGLPMLKYIRDLSIQGVVLSNLVASGIRVDIGLRNVSAVLRNSGNLSNEEVSSLRAL